MHVPKRSLASYFDDSARPRAQRDWYSQMESQELSAIDHLFPELEGWQPENPKNPNGVRIFVPKGKTRDEKPSDKDWRKSTDRNEWDESQWGYTEEAAKRAKARMTKAGAAGKPYHWPGTKWDPSEYGYNPKIIENRIKKREEIKESKAKSTAEIKSLHAQSAQLVQNNYAWENTGLSGEISYLDSQIAYYKAERKHIVETVKKMPDFQPTSYDSAQDKAIKKKGIESTINGQTAKISTDVINRLTHTLTTIHNFCQTIDYTPRLQLEQLPWERQQLHTSALLSYLCAVKALAYRAIHWHVKNTREKDADMQRFLEIYHKTELDMDVKMRHTKHRKIPDYRADKNKMDEIHQQSMTDAAYYFVQLHGQMTLVPRYLRKYAPEGANVTPPQKPKKGKGKKGKGKQNAESATPPPPPAVPRGGGGGRGRGRGGGKGGTSGREMSMYYGSRYRSYDPYY